MGKTILKIEKDEEGLLVVSIDEVDWEVSDKLKNLLLKDIKNHLGGEFSDEFDPKLHDAIKKIKSCIKSSSLDDNGPNLFRVK